MEYYSAKKRDTSESVLMRWMSLEPIIQSEISQKEKDKYCILNGTEEFIYRQQHRNRHREDLWAWVEGRRG